MAFRAGVLRRALALGLQGTSTRRPLWSGRVRCVSPYRARRSTCTSPRGWSWKWCGAWRHWQMRKGERGVDDKSMTAVPELQHNFSGAVILEARVGPRREVTLLMELWPMFRERPVSQWRLGEGPVVELRFGGIENFDEVSAFFEDFKQGRNAWGGAPFSAL